MTYHAYKPLIPLEVDPLVKFHEPTTNNCRENDSNGNFKETCCVRTVVYDGRWTADAGRIRTLYVAVFSDGGITCGCTILHNMWLLYITYLQQMWATAAVGRSECSLSVTAI